MAAVPIPTKVVLYPKDIKNSGMVVIKAPLATAASMEGI